MSGHHIDFVTFHLARQHHFGHPRHDAVSQLSGHLLRTVLIQIQFVSDLPVRQIQPHEIQAQQPDSQRLMMPLEDRVGQIVKLPAARTALVSLPTPLSVIEPTFGDLLRTTIRTTHSFRPAQPPNRFKTFVVINQRQQSQFHSWLRLTIIPFQTTAPCRDSRRNSYPENSTFGRPPRFTG